LAWPEDAFEDDVDLDAGDDVGIGLYDESLVAIELELAGTPCSSRPRLGPTGRRAGRRELRWFYTRMRGRVPAVGEAPPREVAAAARIGRWLSELAPNHRGAFVLRYDGRRWPARLLREFGGLTSILVRFSAMRRPRGPTETVAEAEEAAVAELLLDIAAAGRPVDFTPSGAVAMERRKKLRRLRRAAHNYVRRAEHAYFDERGGAPCVLPGHSREGA
jgi:hypothetical protein